MLQLTGESFAYSFHIGIFQSRRRLESEWAAIQSEDKSQIGDWFSSELSAYFRAGGGLDRDARYRVLPEISATLLNCSPGRSARRLESVTTVGSSLQNIDKVKNSNAR